MGINKFLVAAMSAGVILSVASVSSLADSKTGWKGSDADGWRYYTSDTVYVQNDWKQIDGKWYFFNDDGYAFIDTWENIDGKLYHFDSKGAMETGKWIDCGEHIGYSFFSEDEFKGVRDWRYVGSDGAAYTGWKKIDSEWYYFEEIHDDQYHTNDAMMRYGWTPDNYYIDATGHLKTNSWGHHEEYDIWVYFGEDGKAYEGWHQIDGDWYLFDNYWDNLAFMCTGLNTKYDDDNGYRVWCFDDSGKLLTSGWHETTITEYDYSTSQYTKRNVWIYSGTDGLCRSSQWLNYNNHWYYFDHKGIMVSGIKDYYINGKMYTFDSSGICTNPDSPKDVNGWYLIEPDKADTYSYGPIYVYVENGSEYQKRWLRYNHDWYYFDVCYDYNGVPIYNYMVTDAKDYEINGKCYDFDEEGICLNPDGIVYSGWIQDGDHWLYYGPDSKMYKSSWHNINGKWYYFDYSGYMMTGLHQEWLSGNKSVYYYFNQDGAMLTGWAQVKINGYTCWIYAGSDGVLYQNRWFNYNGSWYYFNGYKMLSGVKNFSIDGRKYDFDNSGKCTNPYNGRK